jgi:hypothetical protein
MRSDMKWIVGCHRGSRISGPRKGERFPPAEFRQCDWDIDDAPFVAGNIGHAFETKLIGKRWRAALTFVTGRRRGVVVRVRDVFGGSGWERARQYSPGVVIGHCRDDYWRCSAATPRPSVIWVGRPRASSVRRNHILQALSAGENFNSLLTQRNSTCPPPIARTSMQSDSEIIAKCSNPS